MDGGEKSAHKAWTHNENTRRREKMKIDGYFLITYSISLLQSVPWQNQEPKREMENKKINVICCWGCCGCGKSKVMSRRLRAMVGNSFFNAVSAKQDCWSHEKVRKRTRESGNNFQEKRNQIFFLSLLVEQKPNNNNINSHYAVTHPCA